LPRVVLISTYELGRQPFGVASPAAWLRAAGCQVTSLDLSRQNLDRDAVASASLIALYLPMHTATRLALALIPKLRQANPSAHLCAYGLYAPMNAALLREMGVGTILGGEFEEGLASLARRLDGTAVAAQVEPEISLARQKFLVPDRAGLPALKKYARLRLPGGRERVVGYTEASRGCKHLCRHCPIVPVYNGKFRIVAPEVVLEDICRQVAAGAQHITFGDPDFWNGLAHARGLVRELHREFPALTFDVTIKVEHLLKHAGCLEELRQTGCAFVTTAVESLDDQVLRHLDKHHTRADFLELVRLFREVGLALAPTFVPFTPWTTLDSYADLLETLATLGLVEAVPPVQLAIRLLIPAGSRLLELPEVQALVGSFDQRALSYCWENPDPRVEALQQDLQMMVAKMVTPQRADREDFFRQAWQRTRAALREGRGGAEGMPLPDFALAARATVPYLTEPWYC
jgi:radical SAM superfamily enzyme YgiQ (UPF0313 family)